MPLDDEALVGVAGELASAKAASVAALAGPFFLARREAGIARWRVTDGTPEHKWLLGRLQGYPVGRTNKFLFQRPANEAEFERAALYLANEFVEAAACDRRRFASPLPDGNKYDPDRYDTFSGQMLGAILRAMEKNGDVVKNKGGGTMRGPTLSTGFNVTEWTLSPELFEVLRGFVCARGCDNPEILMRISWDRLSDADKNAFRGAWIARENRLGRPGYWQMPIYKDVHGPDGKIVRRRAGIITRMNADGTYRWPTESDWSETWKDATWYPQADGRVMTADEAGVAAMLVTLARSNAFSAKHEWRNERGEIEPATCRMSHRVFRDDTLEQHGRFYFGGQNINKDLLAAYTVNGEGTDTGDIACTHPTILLARAGRSIAEYDDDVYGSYAQRELDKPEALRQSLLTALAGREIDDAVLAAWLAPAVIRKQWKLGFSVCLNARSRESAISALARISYDDPSAGGLCPPGQLTNPNDLKQKPFWSRARIEQVVDTLTADLVFGPHMCKKLGPALMRDDARWMERVRHRCEAANIAYRDCHDSITCAVSRRDDVHAIMVEEWTTQFDFPPHIAWEKKSKAEAMVAIGAAARQEEHRPDVAWNDSSDAPPIEMSSSCLPQPDDLHPPGKRAGSGQRDRSAAFAALAEGVEERDRRRARDMLLPRILPRYRSALSHVDKDDDAERGR